ncbi:MAG: 2Fe-2S iron-sulfur cluster-binding protein, partial [Actinomycetes bacterium]
MTTLNVNGKQVNVDVEPEMPLLWVLRDELGLTGSKYACGIAACGACTVHVDGQPIGFGKDSRLPSEFDLSGVVTPGVPFELALTVVRW